MSGSITVLTRYHGKGSSPICVAVLCVAVGIVGAIWFIYFIWLIYSWVTIDSLFSVPLGGLPGFPFYGFSVCVSLGYTLGGIPSLLVFFFTLGVGALFFCFLVGYLSLRLPSFLFVDFCYATLGITLNSSARFLSVVWCVSFILAKVVFDVGCFNASTKYRDANVAVSSDDTLGIFAFCRENPPHHKFFLISFLSQNICSIYILSFQTDVTSGYSMFVPCFPLCWFFMCSFFVPGGPMGVA